MILQTKGPSKFIWNFSSLISPKTFSNLTLVSFFILIRTSVSVFMFWSLINILEICLIPIPLRSSSIAAPTLLFLSATEPPLFFQFSINYFNPLSPFFLILLISNFCWGLSSTVFPTVWTNGDFSFRTAFSSYCWYQPISIYSKAFW